MGGATNLDGDVGDSWKSPYLLAREQRGRVGSGSSSSQSGGRSNIGGGVGNGPEFDTAGCSGSDGHSNAEINGKY